MENPKYVEAMQNLRRSNAATPMPSGKKYKRHARTEKASRANTE